MTTSIGAVRELVAVIQRQLASPVTARAAGEARTGAPAGTQPTRYAPEQLAQLIEARVRQISRDDPQRGRRAFRVFLEAVLLSHFGEHLINDARFHQVVADVQGAMEADPACHVLIDRAMQHLLGPEA